MTHYIASDEVVARYRISQATLYRWENDPHMGFPVPLRINRRRLWNPTELDAWDRAKRPLVGLPGVPSAA